MATITGVAGTTINAVCTVSNDGQPITSGESAATAQSMCNDLATISTGDCTFAGNKVFSGNVAVTGTLGVTGLSTLTGGANFPSGAPLTMVAGSTSSINTELTLGASVVTKAITNATNATPIVVTTSTAHGFLTGDQVTVESVLGNTAANGQWVIKFLNGTQFSLVGSAGSGAYTSGGDCYRLPMEAFNSARAVVRTLSAAWNDGSDLAGTRSWSMNGTHEFVANNSAPTLQVQVFGYDIDIPQGASLATATIYMQPETGAHANAPAAFPTLTIMRKALATGATSTLGTATFPNGTPGGSAGAYEVYTAFSATLGTAEIVDNQRFRYSVFLQTETGTDALSGTIVFGASASYSARHTEQF